MKRYIVSALVVVCTAVVMQAPLVQAQEDSDAVTTMSMAEMLEIVQQLTAQIEQLQAQLAAQRGEMQELREEIRSALREGDRGEEVRKLQELLASDEDIYPEKLVTGYFGPLTHQALNRLQQRHNLATTGELDEDTRDVINQYFEEKQNRSAPEGLLRAPGIMQAVERGVCDRGRGSRPFCPAVEEMEEKEQTAKDGEDESDDLLGECGLEEFTHMIGERADRDAVVDLWEEVHGTEATTRSVRVLGEGDPMTMDYVTMRVNVFYDEDEVVTRVSCG